MGKIKRICGIYSISSIINYKTYIGHSKSIRKRWQNHRNSLRKNDHKNSHLQSSWNMYGEKNFIFDILEILPSNLTKEEYEKVETKWVLEFQTHISEFGYNAVLPGSIPLYRDIENKTKHKQKSDKILSIGISYTCINIFTGDITTAKGPVEVSYITGIPKKNVAELAGYWRKTDFHKKGHGSGFKKSKKGWIVIKGEDYTEGFDYIGFKKQKPKSDISKSRKELYTYKKKTAEEIVPYRERKLKRIPIIAVNCETGEEIYFEAMSDSYEKFIKTKVRKCINSPFMKYSHRGHWFKKA